MSKRGLKYLLVGLLLLQLTGCIRDEIEPCPPLEIRLAVKDKNYFNVDKVDLEERVDEDLPFRTYVPNLYYQLRDADSGEILEEQEIPQIDSDEKEFVYSHCCLPHGEYIVTVWGGITNPDKLDDYKHTLTLHPEHTQGDDVYLVCDTLVYDAYTYSHKLEMERTKGKLIVQSFNLPAHINASEITADHLWGQVDESLNYSGQTEVTHPATFEPQFEIVDKSLLAPSTGMKNTILKVDFYRESDSYRPLVMSPPDINITMHRNELTVVRYVYDAQNNEFLIYVLINDSWQQVHGLIIN
ncbi:MAG: hypothetical protein IJA03_02440 [Bacteroidaceae bacterium]|nr:hypothetical protein [Bacteroidaceae bacterium]